MFRPFYTDFTIIQNNEKPKYANDIRHRQNVKANNRRKNKEARKARRLNRKRELKIN